MGNSLDQNSFHNSSGAKPKSWTLILILAISGGMVGLFLLALAIAIFTQSDESENANFASSRIEFGEQAHLIHGGQEKLGKVVKFRDNRAILQTPEKSVT